MLQTFYSPKSKDAHNVKSQIFNHYHYMKCDFHCYSYICAVRRAFYRLFYLYCPAILWMCRLSSMITTQVVPPTVDCWYNYVCVDIIQQNINKSVFKDVCCHSLQRHLVLLRIIEKNVGLWLMFIFFQIISDFVRNH